MYIDFAALKNSVSIQEVCEAFDIELKGSGAQLRGQCPMCLGSERGLAVNAKDGVFSCHTAPKVNGKTLGGDIIALIAHTEGMRMRDAAQEIAKRCKPEDEPPKQEPGELQPLSYLQFDHEDHFLDEETAERLGIGYAPKGLMRGHFAIPIRLSDGRLVGYIGVKPGSEVHLPKSFG